MADAKDLGIKSAEITLQHNLHTEAFQISDNVIDNIQARIKLSTKNKREILEDTVSINARKKHWSDYSEEDWRLKQRITIKDFLQNTGLVEKNKQHLKKVWDRIWTEHLKWSDPVESEFLKKVQSVWPEQQVEVMQITTFLNGTMLNQSAAVGSGDYIPKTELDIAIQDLDIIKTEPDEIYLVHNHYDEYEGLELPPDAEPRDGYATVGGLSKADIQFADKLQKETLNGKAKVFIVAVSERGLTFSYEAGTSEFRDWENDHD